MAYVKFSEFITGTPPRNTDILVGLRNSLNEQSVFSGVADSNGANIVTWSQAAGPNVNWVDIANSLTTFGPTVSAKGADSIVNLNIGGKGASSYTQFLGTRAIAIPAGTTAEEGAGVIGGLRYDLDTDYIRYWDIGENQWVDIIAGAAFDYSTYVTNTDETATLPNSQPLSAQVSGFLTSLTGTGIITNRLLATASSSRITITNVDGVAGNPEFDLATTTVTPGGYTYAGFSVDAYGRITAASSGVPPIASISVTAPITTTGGSTPTIGLDVPLEVQYGGTGLATLTENMPILGGTTPTGATQTVDPTGALPGFVLEFVDANTPPIWAVPSGPSEIITQASHGFSVGEALYLNGTVYTLALADNTVTAEVVGVVSLVIDVNNFLLTTVGKITGLAGLTPGAVSWLSDVTPGLVTETIPTTEGNITKPIWIADTTTSAYVYQERGKILPNPAYTGFAFVAIASSPQEVVTSTGFITNGSGLITYTIPLAAAVTDFYTIGGGTNTTGWQIDLDASQTMIVGNRTSTAGGIIASTHPSDSVSFYCTGSGTFKAYSYMGNIDVT